jgi:hypothetical protein
MSALVDTRVFLLAKLSHLMAQKPTGTLNEMPYYSSPNYRQIELQLQRLLAQSSKADLLRVRDRIDAKDEQARKYLNDYIVSHHNKKDKSK